MSLLAASAILLQVATIIFMDWVPTPLNRNIAGMSVRERLPSTAIHGLLGLAFAAMNLRGWKWGVLAGALWFSLVLTQAVLNWWVPYLSGMHRGEITPEIYERHYARNVRILPQRGMHPVIPDVQHTLIHLIVLASAVLSWATFAAS